MITQTSQLNKLVFLRPLSKCFRLYPSCCISQPHCSCCCCCYGSCYTHQLPQIS